MMQAPDRSPPRFVDVDREAAELRKLILKLRWIGHETEADRLCAALVKKAPDQICVEQPLLTD